MHVKILTANNLQKRGWPAGRIRSTASCVMGHWRQEFIYLCFALSQEMFGTRFCPGRILGCISHNGPYMHGQMVGGGGNAQTGPQVVQWNPHLYYVEPVKREE
jgi:hypothetical protein